jgi:hypothetical protein
LLAASLVFDNLWLVRTEGNSYEHEFTLVLLGPEPGLEEFPSSGRVFNFGKRADGSLNWGVAEWLKAPESEVFGD